MYLGGEPTYLGGWYLSMQLLMIQIRMMQRMQRQQLQLVLLLIVSAVGNVIVVHMPAIEG